MLHKIMCKLIHPLYDALPGPYAPVRVTRGRLVAQRYTFSPPRCRTSQYRRKFIPISVSLWNELDDSVFDGVGLAGFKSRASAFLLVQLLASLSLLSFYGLVLWGCGLRTDRVLIALSQPFIANLFNNNNNNNVIITIIFNNNLEQMGFMSISLFVDRRIIQCRVNTTKVVINNKCKGNYFDSHELPEENRLTQFLGSLLTTSVSCC